VLLGQKAQLSKSFVLATALTERIFDALTLVLVAFAAIRQLGLAASWLAPALNGMLAVGFIGLALLLASRRLERPLLALLARLPLPQRFRPALDSFTRNFLLGMRSFQHPGRAVGFASLTAIIWLGDGLTANLVARAFGLNLALPGALLLISALGLSSAVPSTPGYIGVYQFVAVTVLMPLGFLRSEALACSITLQAVSVVGCLLWGSLGLWRLGGLPQRARDE
jgi:uncharacterized membrane protein YbhN (UPF0104 family)